MKIVIVGCGNVGTALAEQLSKEGHSITVVDEKEELVNSLSDTYDIMGFAGNGAVYSVQQEAGIREADLLIAVTGQDELNLLCCLIARKAGGAGGRLYLFCPCEGSQRRNACGRLPAFLERRPAGRL